MNATRTRRWLALVRALPYELQSDEQLLNLIREDKAEEIVAYLSGKLDEAVTEAQDFRRTHVKLARIVERRDKRYMDWLYGDDGALDDALGDSLRESSDEEAETDWYRDEMSARKAVVNQLRRVVDDAADIGGAG